MLISKTNQPELMVKHPKKDYIQVCLKHDPLGLGLAQRGSNLTLEYIEKNSSSRTPFCQRAETPGKIGKIQVRLNDDPQGQDWATIGGGLSFFLFM